MSKNFELEGVLIVKGDEEAKTPTFRTREFVVEVANEQNSDWNDYIKFQLTQDRCANLDPYNLGDRIKVTFNISGRKWEKDGKVNYFSNLSAWKLESVQNDSAPDTPPTPPPFVETEVPKNEDDGDFPF